MVNIIVEIMITKAVDMILVYKSKNKCLIAIKITKMKYQINK